MSNQFFYTFMALIGVILAVLAFVVGQLFPIYATEYAEQHEMEIVEKIRTIQQAENIELTDEEMRAFEQAILEEDSNHQFIEEQNHLYWLIALLFLVAFGLIWFVANRVIFSFMEPIVNITKTARELSVGNYRARAFANGPKTIVELRESVNVLARNLQDITRTRQIEEERLKTLIENMGSALLMLDREGNITIVNRRFLQRFNLQLQDVLNENFSTLGLPEELNIFIDHVYLTELPYRKQLTMTLGNDQVHKQAYGAPVIGEHGRWLGIVIVMHDVSELLRLEQIRRDFVANVSHELRTPITSIKGFSETLLDGAFRDEQMLLSFLEIIHKESNRLQELVHDLLELSKIEQYGFKVETYPTSLQDVLIRVIELTTPKLDSKEMQFDIDIVKDVTVKGDANRLIQIFTNLVANAIMYSPVETTITIRITSDEKYGIVEVIDEGIGIEKADIPRVFERFYRVDKARARNSGGTGLGLAIVKHLLEAHEGKIVVASEVGKGTTMRVCIPLAI